MPDRTANTPFKPGFRILPHDKWVLLSFLLLSPLLYHAGGHILLVYSTIVIFQFFLFCNVFRIPNRLEFWWLMAVLPVYLVSRQLHFNLILEAGALLIWGLVIILVGMRQQLYCGVFWKKINPQLPEKWAQHLEQQTQSKINSNAKDASK
jgi:hypothetical protein